MQIFKKFCKQYQKAKKEGLIGVDENWLQVDNATFNELFAEQRVEKKISGEYLWKQGDITIISLFPLQDLININELGEKF